jgi:hypothetical protein
MGCPTTLCKILKIVQMQEVDWIKKTFEGHTDFRISMLQLTIQAKSSAPLEGASPFMVFLTYFVADLN